MSRAWAPCKTIFVTLATAALIGGCIFSPSPAPPEPPAPPPPIESSEDLIEALSNAYQSRRYDRIQGLFHDDYLFVLYPDPTPDPTQPPPPENWGKTEELRIHRRMFTPQDTPPDETPVPGELWLTGVGITLSESAAFEEVMDYYRTDLNPNGLPQEDWTVRGAEYNTSVLFETQGETDYQVTGTAWFVVVEDKSKTGSEPGRFLLYRWQDLGGSGKPSRLTL
jgi:hypothetical protein